MHRRLLLGASAAALSTPALAQQRQPRGGPARPAPPPMTPATSPLGPVDTAARFALLVDFETGATLLDKNADERMPPASMSKLMTMYQVFDLIRKGRLAMDQQLPVSEAAWRTGGSKMFLELNATVSVEIVQVAEDKRLDRVPVAARGLAEGRSVTVEPASVVVVLRGPRAQLAPITVVTAYVDVTEMAPGRRYSLPVKVDPLAGVQVAAIEPATVAVRVK